MNIKNNKSKLSILLIGAKGCSVSEGLLKCLRNAKYENITILEHSKNAAHIYRVDNYLITNKTPDDGEDYIDNLITICKENNIDVVLPGSTWEARIISEFKDKLNKSNIITLVNNIETITIGDDKWNTYEYLSKLGIGTPETFLDIEEVVNNEKTTYPIIIKPRQGRGSQNIFIAQNEIELRIICDYFVIKGLNYIIQEFIGRNDHEYTVGVISDKNGKVIQSIVMKRLLLGGATGYAEVCEPGFINEFCEDVARKVNSTGPINIQLRLDNNNKPSLFEINPRFSGSAPMRTLAGFNEPQMIINNFFYDEEIAQQKISYGNKYYRAFQEIEIPKNSEKGQISNLL
ncbi:ATP-grasp domain-containing protein [uncultured Flavobacterium sp.]|uniref:ATP-grasp domain-containing protein n=1 Tax=uncultured Flavobacterium sp. TaxID=165435 RepID=UPI0030EDD5AF|tara:strand:- start:76052 stop:77086 length:1035 start_codon:yes stop_codon:yes gene_type:complete